MALPAPPARPAPLAEPPTVDPAPRHIVEVDDLPYVAPGSGRPATGPVPTAGRRGGAPLEPAARVGLVLAVVVALVGVLGAVAKHGERGDTSRLASHGASAVDVEDPLADDDTQEATDPSDDRSTAVAAGDPYLVPDGYQVVQGDGVYLSVPASWTSLSARTMSRMFDDDSLEDLYPDLDGRVRAAMRAAVDQGAIVMAIDPAPAGGGRNLNVLSAPGVAPLDELAAQAERDFQQLGLGIEVRERREVDTPVGRALRLAYSAEVAGQPFDAVQYYVPADGTTYIVTGTGADDVTDQAVQTLRLGEAPQPT